MTARIRFFSALGGFVLFLALLLFAPAAARASQCGSVDSLIEAAQRGGTEYKWTEGRNLRILIDMYFSHTGALINAERAMVAKVSGGFVVAFADGGNSCFGMIVPDASDEGNLIQSLIFGRRA